MFKKQNTFFLVSIFVTLFSLQVSAIQVNSNSKKFKRSRTFLEESFKIIRRFIKNSNNLTADFSMKCKPPGGIEFAILDASFFYKSTNYFSMTVSGECPFQVIVSNNIVYTTFTKTGETDIRPLADGEKVFDDFLGICPFYNQDDFVINFFIEDNLYVVSAVLKPEICAELSLAFLNNARKAVQRILWLDPAKEKIVKSQVITLEGKETLYYY